MRDLNGLMVVVTSPFRDGKIDLNALQTHLHALLPFATGFVLGGTTGESFSLSDAELISMLQSTRTVIGEKVLFVGFWRPTVATTMAAATVFAPLADALLIPIPQELLAEDENVIEKYFQDLARVIPKPIFLYNFPARCQQRAISVDLAARLASKCSNIVGVKDSSENGQLVQDIIQKQLPLHALTGNDRLLTKTLVLAQQTNFKTAGASMSGASSVPKIARIEAEIYRLCKSGEVKAAEALQQKLAHDFFDIWQQYASQLGGQSALVKYHVSQELPDYPIEVRPPLKLLTPEIHDRLKEKL